MSISKSAFGLGGVAPGARLLRLLSAAAVGTLLVATGCAVEPGSEGADDDGVPEEPLGEAADALDAQGFMRLRSASITASNVCVSHDPKFPKQVSLTLCENAPESHRLAPTARKFNGKVMYQLRFKVKVGATSYCLSATGPGANGSVPLGAAPCRVNPTDPGWDHFLLDIGQPTTRVCLGSGGGAYCLHPNAAGRDVALSTPTPANASSPIWRWVNVPFPDRDGDGVADARDRCAGGRPGQVAPDGCPDADGDKIPDIDDKCPNEPGPARNDPTTNGCPDTDGDGIVDKFDLCDTQKGPANSPRGKGCPVCADGTNGRAFDFCFLRRGDMKCDGILNNPYTETIRASGCTADEALTKARAMSTDNSYAGPGACSLACLSCINGC
ncbi:MAG: hypothetical protein JST00_35685 [Deltaproteobacteria bacterium]|nr:hypothetical protein [Deltaproteobacteria bacterium]